MAPTILTPAENRFLQLSYPALSLPELTRLMPRLREHPTVKTTSDFLTRGAKQDLTANRIEWLVAASAAWKLLARLPYKINTSEQRRDWRHCALCHLPVRYEYHVVLRLNGREIVVGSECVKKFMSDEMQYLMTITTENNFHAVAQYDTLTAKYPQVPDILWTKDALPHLSQPQRHEQTRVRRGTQATVTGYLKRRTTVLPEPQLAPDLQAYTRLQKLDRAAQQRQLARQQTQVAQTQRATEQAQQRAWQVATQTKETAQLQLRQSTEYQRWLAQVAALMVERLTLREFKTQLATLDVPQAVTRLVNAYQLGVMATEFTRQGQIKAQRLQIVPRDLVADLDQRTRALAVQRQRDWNDDVFNATLGSDLTPVQRVSRLTALQHIWEGRQIPAAIYEELAHFKATVTRPVSVPVDWPEPLRRAFQQRLARQPADQWVPAKKNHVTPQQLRQLGRQSADWPTIKTAFQRLYALPAPEEAVTLSALEQYYLRQRDRRRQQATQTQRLLQSLLEEK
ncbi:hypothetical protein [Levilactobacillus acidifarinae]|uniref:Uncharacterized protein n=1 Tax=Levilactobacillus acidifarinae DSM 19394 = JCM 15949 TaxID=1423715 RepID=A0A0R1LJT9_9LACO|nr:hypothetical protein [Levilactobacillus acidifarinae]KRK96174.1 hypothetical protein FD25_GL002640 [Levilactobacillus acidifarinae DSM 19394]GEO69536.1 hypothetical protein LAC03_14460 [Levilactobacillus acidifarinae]